MIEEILPPAAAAADTFEDAQGAVLFPAEEAAISRAVGKRRREFTTARACARDALARLGVPAAPIVPGERGAPQWPPGVVGSMTHCRGYRAAAVARRRDLVTIGLDAEPDDALPDRVLDAIVTAGERAWLTELMTAQPQMSWDRLLFSAKESVYKAWFPLTGRWLGFKDAAITVSAADGTFTASLLVPGPAVNGVTLTSFAGRWLARNGLVVTAIAVPATSSGPT
jgi:4'-phosphopantetheinyl transferase EntD